MGPTVQGSKRTSGTEDATRNRDGLAVVCQNVVKEYSVASGPQLWAAVPFVRRSHGPSVVALAGVNLEIAPGTAVGVIGPNGAGKSTLLKVLAGVTSPTSGTATAFGTVRSVIELGVGFHPELTGRENLRCGSVMLGQSREETRASLDSIERFAGLGDAIDMPIKQYSMGMKARLGFALATEMPMDVLLIDEVLAVGDREFQSRCVERILGFVESGTALVFVSHEMPLVAQICDRVVQIRGGRVVDDGAAVPTIERYVAVSTSSLRTQDDPPVVVERCWTPDVVAAGEVIDIVAEVLVKRPMRRPSIGLDLMLPLVEPDRILASSIDPLPAWVVPGRYRITGTGRPLPGLARNLRLTVSILDRDSQLVCGSAHDDVLVLGDPASTDVGVRGYRLTLPIEWSITADAVPGEAVTSSDPVLPSTGSPRRTGASVPAVEVAGVTKRYRRSRLRHSGSDRRADHQADLGDHREALRDVNLTVHAGEAVGIIGPNGAGKTTLLRALAGITAPDAGTVRIAGVAIPMLELGVGFHDELTGLDNVRTVARLLGLDATATERAIPEILEFSGVADAADVPVKHYSAGMKARLGFSLAIHAPGDVLLIDEVLAVGDEEFRRQAMDAVAARRANGATVLFVSHELMLVEHLCDRTVWLDRGRVVADGSTASVVDSYSGRSWAGGVHDADSGVRLLPMSVTQRHLRTGGHVVLEGTLVVDEPLAHARMEVSYRAAIADRSAALTIAERELQSIFTETVVPAGDLLSRPGVHRYRCQIGGEQLLGRLDAIMTVVDDRTERILAEVWQEVTYGSPAADAPPAVLLDFDWVVESSSGRS